MAKQLFAVASLVAVIFLVSTHLVEGQIHYRGACPKVKTQQKLDVQKYFGKGGNGTWWIYEQVPSYFYEGDHCLTTSYQSIDKKTFYVQWSQIDRNNQRRTTPGWGKVAANGKFYENFGGNPVDEFYAHILKTDYKNYAVMFRCDAVKSDEVNIYYWILTREQKPKSEVVEKGRAVLEAQGLDLVQLVKYDNNNCS